MKSGIYTITNKIDGKIYVGYSNNIARRMSGHRQSLIKNTHKNEYLQNSVNKYGIDSFMFEVLEYCDEPFLPSLENYWCKMLSTHDRKYGYNIRPTDSVNGNKKLSAETKTKLSKYRTGIKHTNEFKDAMSLRNSGAGNPMYGKSGILAPCYGRTGSAHPMFGNTHTEEARIKISNATKGGLNGHAKPVINTATGEVFMCATDASKNIGVKYFTLTSWLNGAKRNKSTLKYLKEEDIELIIIGIGLLFSPDDIINNLIKKDGSNNTGSNQPPAPQG